MVEKLFRNRQSPDHYLPQIGQYLDFLLTFRLPEYATIPKEARLPGIVLEKFSAMRIDVGEDEYREGQREHGRIIPTIRKAFAAHAETGALLYLAFGQEAVECMTRGYTCDFHGCQVQAHHNLPQDVRAVGSTTNPANALAVNDLRNYTFVPGTGHFTKNSGPPDPRHNFHQFFHAISNPQFDGPREEEFDFFALRPVFPCYPPLPKPMSGEEIRLALGQWEKRARDLDIDHFMERWGPRLKVFSECIDEGGYCVPESEAAVARGQFVFPGLGAKTNRPRRVEIARNSLAAKYLPASASIHDVVMEASHEPQVSLPVFSKSYSWSLETLPRKSPGFAPTTRAVSLAAAGGMHNLRYRRASKSSTALAIESVQDEVPF